MFKQYYHLTKPGIIRGNLVAAIAGFLLASQGEIDLILFLCTLLGTSFVIACGCVLNNYLDKSIDAKMPRTDKRALVTGAISDRNALVFAAILGVAGTWLLYTFVNPLTAFIGLFGLFAYVVLYGLAKRRTVHGTLVGTISGAIPPVAGYTAVSGDIDQAAIILFLILVFWQMPHFYAIAIYRQKDYAAAKLPVLPVIKGVRATKAHILAYIIGFGLVSTLLYFYGYAGELYLVVVVLLSAVWIYSWLNNVSSEDAVGWARRLFFVSLIVLLGICTAIGIDSFIY